jgi:serine/threonine protein kinase
MITMMSEGASMESYSGGKKDDSSSTSSSDEGRGVAIPKVPWSSIDIQYLLGEGGFCRVRKCHVNHPEFQDASSSAARGYALKSPKLLPNKGSNQESLQEVWEELVMEAEILQQLHHENIIVLHGISTSPEDEDEEDVSNTTTTLKFSLLLELLDDTLDQRLQQWRRSMMLPGMKRKMISEDAMNERIQSIALGVASAMQYLHEKQIVLRDLKPENIGLNYHPSFGLTPKLFDFGFARRMDQINYREIAGTPHYMAPEVVLELGTGFPSDVYSFGLVLYELCTLQLPYKKDWFSWFANRSETQLYQRKFCWRPSVKLLPNTELKELVADCWAFKPSARPTFSTIRTVLRRQVSPPGMLLLSSHHSRVIKEEVEEDTNSVTENSHSGGGESIE